MNDPRNKRRLKNIQKTNFHKHCATQNIFFELAHCEKKEKQFSQHSPSPEVRIPSAVVYNFQYQNIRNYRLDIRNEQTCFLFRFK